MREKDGKKHVVCQDCMWLHVVVIIVVTLTFEPVTRPNLSTAGCLNAPLIHDNCILQSLYITPI